MKQLKNIWVLGVLVLIAGCTKSPSTAVAPPTQPQKIETVAALQAAVQKTPSFGNVIALGLALSTSGKHEEALSVFQRAASISPQSPLAYNNICAEHNALRQWAPAIENCQKALKLEPGFTLASNNLAYSQKSKALQDSKIAELEKAIKDGKATDKNRVDLGMEFYSRGEYDRAVELWKTISEKSELYAIAQNDLASAYIILKKFDLAKTSIGKALEREPKNQLFLNNRQWLQSASQAAAH